jgi:Flp pilus assembly protein TadD
VSGRRALFGDADLETLRAVNNLAGTVAAQGDFTRARELLASVLAITSREFGEHHPDSLTTMSNLAAVLWQEGDRAEAYALQQQVVEMRRREEGDNHEATRAAAAVIEMMERDPGY